MGLGPSLWSLVMESSLVGTSGPSTEPWETVQKAVDSQYFPTDFLFHIEYLSCERLLVKHSRNCWTLKQGVFLTHTHVQWEPHKVLWWSLLLKILYFRKALGSQQTERKEQTSPFPFPSHIHSLSHCQHLPSFGSFVQIHKPLWTLHQHPAPTVCTTVHSGVGHSMGLHKQMTCIHY